MFAGFSWVIRILIAFTPLLFLLSACDEDPDEVIVYTSVDQHYSEPLFHAFKEATGITIRAVYDVEASRTTGLVSRLIAEAANPQADVFWNGEVMQMQRLLHQQILTPYHPEKLPEGARLTADGHWIEFGGRARVLIVNASKLGARTVPTSILDLESGGWSGKDIAIAYPVFGTTATHAAALDGVWGRTRALEYFSNLQQRGVRFVAGNSVVRDLVVSGQALFGLTDTDDACGAVARGDPVFVVLPDQEPGGLGALVIPNSVGLIASGKNKENAKEFINFLTGPDAMKLLAKAGWFYVDGQTIIADPVCGLGQTLSVMPLKVSGTPADLAQFQQALKALIVR